MWYYFAIYSPFLNIRTDASMYFQPQCQTVSNKLGFPNKI